MPIEIAQQEESDSTPPVRSASPPMAGARTSLRRVCVCVCAMALDCVIVLASARLAADAYLGAGTMDRGLLLRGGALCAAVFCALMWSSGGYGFRCLAVRPLGILHVLSRWALSILLLALVLFLFKQGAEVSRGTTVLFAVAGTIALSGGAWIRHVLLRRLMAYGAVVATRVVLIGTRAQLRQMPVRNALRAQGVALVGAIQLEDGDETQDAALTARAMNVARAARADEIILAVPWTQHRRLETLRTAVRTVPLAVRLLPDPQVTRLHARPMADMGFSHAIELQRAPLSIGERRTKRALDLALTSLILLLLCPLMCLVAACVRLDTSGPILFRQRRRGFDGGVFHILKFRTMTCAEDGAVIPQVQPGDTRVTRVGRFLRTSSIDELPQLLNVLAGDMSLVGPRPHAVAHDDHYARQVADYAYRQHVKPGITGWAQVHGLRGATEQLSQMEARVQHDLHYIATWSLPLDLWILLRTAREVLRPRNAR